MNATQIIYEKIGPIGRMVSGSKSLYRKANPNHLVIFNANLCVDGEGKVWHGDLDVTLDKDALSTIAVTIGLDLYVLIETDGRFENELNPKLKEAVVIFKADGSFTIGKRSVYTVIDPTSLKINQ